MSGENIVIEVPNANLSTGAETPSDQVIEVPSATLSVGVPAESITSSTTQTAKVHTPQSLVRSQSKKNLLSYKVRLAVAKDIAFAKRATIVRNQRGRKR